MTRRKINVRTPVAAAWPGMTAGFAALTAKRSRATLSLHANAGMRNVPARSIEQSDHDNPILDGKLERGLSSASKNLPRWRGCGCFNTLPGFDRA